MRLLHHSQLAAAILLVGFGMRGHASDPAKELVLQLPPTASVNSVAVSPDGSLVASAAGNGGIRIYQSRTGQLQRTFGGTTDRCVAFSPDGQKITAAGFHMDKLVPVFDSRTGSRIAALAGHSEWEADAVAISPDGKLLASAGVDMQILVWDLASGELRWRLQDREYRSPAIAFTPDGSMLATGGGDRAIHLWNAKTGEPLRTFEGHRNWVSALAFSPDGQTLVSGSCDWGFHRGHDWIRTSQRGKEVCEWILWDVRSGNVIRAATDSGSMLAVGFAPDGKTFACTIGTQLRLFDVASHSSGRVIVSHDNPITSVAFTPDGTAVITGGHDQMVKRTNVSSGEVEWRAPGYFEQVNAVALAGDSTLLVTATSDSRLMGQRINASAPQIGPGAVRLWDIKSGQLLRTLGDPTHQILCVDISHDGKRVVAGGATKADSGIVCAWDPTTGKSQWTHTDHPAEVLAVAITTDGRFLASGDAQGNVKLRGAENGNVLHTLSGHRRGATSLVFSPDGDTLYCGEGAGGTRIWQVSSGQLQQALPSADARAEGFSGDRLMHSLSLSADGDTLATCASSVNNEFTDPVRLWSTPNARFSRSYASENIHGRPMALSPDATLIATGGKTVKLWDAHTGAMVRELFGILKRTQSIVFTADGRSIVSGGSYGTTNVWDVASGELQFTLFAFRNRESGSDEWLMYCPDHTFRGSNGVEKYLAWREKNDLVPLVENVGK